MKQLIVIMGVLPILLLFLLQFSYDQRSNSAIGAVQSLVYAAKEDAKQEGCFTKEIKEKLKSDIGAALGISPSQVAVESSEAVKYRYSKGDGRLIYYKVSVPMKEVMAGAGIFKMKEAENSYVYVIDSYAASERL